MKSRVDKTINDYIKEMEEGARATRRRLEEEDDVGMQNQAYYWQEENDNAEEDEMNAMFREF